MAAGAFAPARADVFKLTYQAGGTESLVVEDAGMSGSVLGVESFNEIERRGFGSVSPFKTSFGTGGVITGFYSGAMAVNGADQYGGAGGAGNYLATYAMGNGYTLVLAQNGGIPGVNFFGLQLSALDGGNRIDFLRGGQTVFSYTPDTLIKVLGICDSGNPYCGNPTTRANGGEQYAFVRFLNQDNFFDQVWFRASGGGGLETDNHTVGYRSAGSSIAATVVDVPEPQAVALLGAGLLALGLLRARRRNPGDV